MKKVICAATIAAAATVTPTLADEVIETLEAAISAYEEGDIQYALEELAFAQQLLNELRTGELSSFLPEAPEGWTRELDPEGESERLGIARNPVGEGAGEGRLRGLVLVVPELVHAVEVALRDLGPDAPPDAVRVALDLHRDGSPHEVAGCRVRKEDPADVFGPARVLLLALATEPHERLGSEERRVEQIMLLPAGCASRHRGLSTLRGGRGWPGPP